MEPPPGRAEVTHTDTPNIPNIPRRNREAMSLPRLKRAGKNDRTSQNAGFSGRAQKGGSSLQSLYFGAKSGVFEAIHDKALACIEGTVGAPGEAREGCKGAFGRLEASSLPDEKGARKLLYPRRRVDILGRAQKAGSSLQSLYFGRRRRTGRTA